jgi:glycosyltransferase involved in cell wall biosynthesis
MNDPCITIFIPAYKRPHLLKRAMASVLSQTHAHLRLFVADDASNDETVEVLEQFRKQDSRVDYVSHPKNIGMLANYQFGISQIKTDYFSILSDDDVLLPNYCELALQHFSKYPEIAFFAGSTSIFAEEGRLLRAPLEEWTREGLFLPGEGLLEMIGKYPVPTTVMYRTKIATQMQIDFANNPMWDCDFLMQCAGQYPIAISKTPCAHFFVHAHSFTGNLGFSASLRAILRLMDRARAFPWMKAQLWPEVKRRFREDYYKTAHGHIAYYFLRKRFGKALGTCGQLFRQGHFRMKTFVYAGACCASVALPFLFPLLAYLKKFYVTVLRGYCNKYRNAVR